MPGIHENSNLGSTVSMSHKSTEDSLEIMQMKDRVDKDSKIYVLTEFYASKKIKTKHIMGK